MKRNYFSHAIVPLLACAVVLASCTQEVDIKHMDHSADINMGVALPIGDITLTLGDFLGMGSLADYIKVSDGSVYDENVLFYQDTFDISRTFHHINLSSYVAQRKDTMYLASQLPPAAIAAGYIVGDGTTTINLNYDMVLRFNGINQQTTLDDERLDSLVISNARFTSTINKNDLGLDWDEIKEIKITLGDAFRREGGNSFSLPIDAANFGQEIPINVDNFTLNLMKNPNADPTTVGNAIDSTKISISFVCVPRNAHTVNVSKQSRLEYTLKLDFMEYKVIYGRFAPGEEMRDENTIDLAKEWGGWKDIMSLNLPLAQPNIRLKVKHHLGVPIIVNGDYLYATSRTGEKRYATFGDTDADTTLIWAWPNDRYVHHATDYTGFVENTYTFSEQPEHGHLDKIFAIRPDYLSYKFHIEPNYNTVKQASITNDTIIEMQAITTVPFIFNPGVDLSYIDTLTDVNINKFSIDSLIASANSGDGENIIDTIKTANLKLIIDAENWIPFDINAKFTFLDANNSPIDIVLTDSVNSLVFPGPTEIAGEDAIKPGRPSEPNRLILDDVNFRKLARVKNVRVEAALGNNTAKVQLKSTNKLTVKIGVVADVDATLDLSSLVNKDDKKQNTTNEQ